jgi:hypothetical protein
MSLCNLLTIANVVLHRRRAEVSLQPLSLPAGQNPLAAFLLRQAPTVTSQVARPFEEKSPVPVSAFDLSVLRSRGPHYSSCASAETFTQAYGREQFRRVLWYARHP